MDNMITILWQVVTMFLLAAVGFVMFRTGKISQEGSKALGNILIFLSLPCVIINSFLVERTQEAVTGLLVSTLAAAILIALSVFVSRLLLGRNAIDNFASSFSNPGFFGAPLIIASIGEQGVFFIAAFIAFLNLMQWTYGVFLLETSDEHGLLPAKGASRSGGMKVSALAMRLVKAPFMVAILIGLVLFLTAAPLPGVLKKCVSSIAGLNTPLAMFTIGIYMAQTDILKMFTRKRLYWVASVRMVIIPLLSLALLSLLPGSMGNLKLAMLIAAACPVGSNVAVYAQLHNRDYPYAVETVVISTLLSIITLPLIVGFAGILW